MLICLMDINCKVPTKQTFADFCNLSLSALKPYCCCSMKSFIHENLLNERFTELIYTLHNQMHMHRRSMKMGFIICHIIPLLGTEFKSKREYKNYVFQLKNYFYFYVLGYRLVEKLAREGPKFKVNPQNFKYLGSRGIDFFSFFPPFPSFFSFFSFLSFNFVIQL